MTSTIDYRSLRGKPRFKMFQPAQVKLRAEQLRAHILDLSASGALVHSAAALEPGAVIVLELGAWSRAARVEWRHGEKAGVRFALTMSDAEVERLVASPLVSTSHSLRS